MEIHVSSDGQQHGPFPIEQLLFGFGFLMAAFTEKKQALHDTLAGTLVVKK
mgnify:CR=1 FL=1